RIDPRRRRRSRSGHAGPGDGGQEDGDRRLASLDPTRTIRLTPGRPKPRGEGVAGLSHVPWQNGHDVDTEEQAADRAAFSSSAEAWMVRGGGIDVIVEQNRGFATEEMTLNIGPQHPSTHGVLRLVLE